MITSIRVISWQRYVFAVKSTRIFEGDILLDQTTQDLLSNLRRRRVRSAISTPNRKWPSNKIPYNFGAVSKWLSLFPAPQRRFRIPSLTTYFQVRLWRKLFKMRSLRLKSTRVSDLFQGNNKRTTSTSCLMGRSKFRVISVAITWFVNQWKKFMRGLNRGM